MVEGKPSSGDENYMNRLSEIIHIASKEKMQILELGTYTGTSAFLFAEYAQKHNGCVTCIDLWNDEPVRLRWEHNKRAMPKLTTYIKEFRGNTRALLPEFSDDSMDFIYIDGDHTREGARYDMEQSLRIIKDEGIICIHDSYGRPSDYDREWLEMHDGDYIKCSEFNCNIHPGVILAIEDVFQNTGTIIVDHFFKKIKK